MAQVAKVRKSVKKVGLAKKTKPVAKKQASFDAALKHFKKTDPILYKTALPFRKELSAGTGHRRSYQALFAALAGSVVSQQLSTKAADTIWERLKTASGGEVTPEAIAKLRTPRLRKAGLSAAKVKTLKELSRAILKGALDLPGLRKVPEEEAVITLSAVWGIGRWTAEMFLLFALERDDVFSSGDLGLVRSIESLYGLPRNSKKEEYEKIALRWSPHRSIASRVLWKSRDSK